jgi:ABC-2 type transport system ATP-binding protein
MIKVKNLHKSFGRVTALDGISFQVDTGEIVGFLGPNGAGKTTTMRLLTGFLSPDSGSITVDGQSLDQNLRQIQQQIGYLPENNPLYQDMLVAELLNYSASLRGITPAKLKNALDFAVSAMAIDDVYYRPIGELSKGFRQRVGMAAALIHQPNIVIMDEPTEGLDPNQRTEIRKLIKDLAKDRTIILSTHVMQEALAVANRLLIINRGKIVADSTPDKLSAGKDQKVITLEIQGAKITAQLQKLKGATSVTTKRLSGTKYRATLTSSQSTSLQPELSKLIAKNRWVVWKLAEAESDLEDIFAKLTK